MPVLTRTWFNETAVPEMVTSIEVAGVALNGDILTITGAVNSILSNVIVSSGAIISLVPMLNPAVA